jgi:hypothetical protein
VPASRRRFAVRAEPLDGGVRLDVATYVPGRGRDASPLLKLARARLSVEQTRALITELEEVLGRLVRRAKAARLPAV